MASMQHHSFHNRARHRREISTSFLRAFTPLGWACWFLTLATAAYLSWAMARLCVDWMAA